MSDYISREAAIEELRKAADCANCDVGAGGLCGFCDIENAARLINGIPAADVEPVRRWIPCSERLPGSCSVNGETVSCLAYIPSFGAVDIADYHPDVDEWTFMCLPVTVPHWQPLPEPPEEGDAGNGLD